MHKALELEEQLLLQVLCRLWLMQCQIGKFHGKQYSISTFIHGRFIRGNSVPATSFYGAYSVTLGFALLSSLASLL